MNLDSTVSFGIVSFLILTPYLLWTGQIKQLLFQDFNFVAALLFSCTVCVVHTYTTLLTLKLAGPIGVNIAGILKDIVLTWLGFIFFTDIKATH